MGIEIGDTVKNDKGWQGQVIGREQTHNSFDIARRVEYLVQYVSCREWEPESGLRVVAKNKERGNENARVHVKDEQELAQTLRRLDRLTGGE